MTRVSVKEFQKRVAELDADREPAQPSAEEHLAKIANLLAAEEAKTPRAGGVHAVRRLLAFAVIVLILAVIFAARH